MIYGFKKYATLTLFSILAASVASAVDVEAFASSPQAREFRVLAEDALRSQKTSALERGSVETLREALKVGGCLGLFYGAKKANSSYGFKDQGKAIGEAGAAVALGQAGLKETVNAGWDKHKARQAFATYGPHIIMLLAILWPLICDASMHSGDSSLKAMKHLKEYVKTLTTEQKRQLAEVFEREYVDAFKIKFKREGDAVGVKLARALTLIVDLLLPLVPLVPAILEATPKIYNASGYAGKKAEFKKYLLKLHGGSERLDKLQGQLSVLQWIEGLRPNWTNSPHKNLTVLVACAAVFVLNIPVVLSRISSIDGQRSKLLAEIRRELATA